MPNAREMNFRSGEVKNGTFYLNMTVAGTMDVGGTIEPYKRKVEAVLDDRIVTAADNGTVFVDTQATGTVNFTLPVEPTAGMHFTFICGDADSEITITPDASASILAKESAAQDGGNAGLSAGDVLVNTDGSNVVGDAITLVALNSTTWYAISQIGLWEAAA